MVEVGAVAAVVAVAIAQADSRCWVVADIEVATVVADTEYSVAEIPVD